MKKFLSLLIAAAMLVTFAACGNTENNSTTASTEGTVSSGTTGTTATTAGTTATNGTTGTTGTTGTVSDVVKPYDTFDANNIVLSFGAISDIHLERTGSTTKFANALAQLQKQAAIDDKDGIDAIAVVGDIVEKNSQIPLFKQVFEQSGLDCELLFCLGNHDQEIGEALTLRNYYNTLGTSYFSADVENPDLTKGNRHCVVNGYHFVFVQPSSYHSSSGDGVLFSKATVDWLDKTLNEITTADPNAYVFVFAHAMIANTCYGSNYRGTVYTGPGSGSGSYWYTEDLSSTLGKYPQVVTFSGHLHFPINDERSIMQTNFTAIGCGSVSYMAIEDAYDNVSGAKTDDSSSISAGHLVQVDKNGNVRITRMDFSNETTFKTPWILPAPNAEGTNLASYPAARGNAQNNEAPVLSGEIEVNLLYPASIISGTVTFEAAKDDDLVHHYDIKVKNDDTGKTFKMFSHLSDFYKYANVSDMAKTVSISIGSLSADTTYTVEITAVDSWGAKSATLTKTFKATGSANASATLPAAYADIDFANGKATDIKGKLSISVSGALIEKTSLTFAGKTKDIDALNISKAGQYAVASFNEYNVSNITNFYNSASGFSVEALYVNRAPSGTQGIFCGTQNGGWGLASTGAGKPGLCTYIGKNSTYFYATANDTASKEELTHVVGTVFYNTADGKTYTTLYVNGEIVASQVQSGKMISSDSIVSLAIGADIDRNGGGSEFQMTDFSVADLKLYSEALNSRQVETAYENALALFK